MNIVKIGSCGDERDNALTEGRLTPYFAWENNPEREIGELQSFDSAIYGITCLFLEIL